METLRDTSQSRALRAAVSAPHGILRMKKDIGMVQFRNRPWFSRLSLGALLLTAIAAVPVAVAAQDARMTPIPAPAEPNAIRLDTGTVPDSTAPESWFRQYDVAMSRNVTAATLTPFLPDPAKATGAAVIIAPGGGFLMLSMDREGWSVARAGRAWHCRVRPEIPPEADPGGDACV